MQTTGGIVGLALVRDWFYKRHLWEIHTGDRGDNHLELCCMFSSVDKAICIRSLCETAALKSFKTFGRFCKAFLVFRTMKSRNANLDLWGREKGREKVVLWIDLCQILVPVVLICDGFIFGRKMNKEFSLWKSWVMSHYYNSAETLPICKIWVSLHMS